MKSDVMTLSGVVGTGTATGLLPSVEAQLAALERPGVKSRLITHNVPSWKELTTCLVTIPYVDDLVRILQVKRESLMADSFMRLGKSVDLVLCDQVRNGLAWQPTPDYIRAVEQILPHKPHSVARDDLRFDRVPVNLTGRNPIRGSVPLTPVEINWMLLGDLSLLDNIPGFYSGALNYGTPDSPLYLSYRREGGVVCVEARSPQDLVEQAMALVLPTLG